MAYTVSVEQFHVRFQDDDGEMAWACFDKGKLPIKFNSIEEARTAISLHSDMAQMNWASLSRRHISSINSAEFDGKEVVIIELMLEVDGIRTILQRSIYTINSVKTTD